MHRQNFQDILVNSLGLIEMPSRYLGNEVNAVKKDLAQMDLTVALTFPDLYEIGTSHFGLQILYSILNDQPKIAAERFFCPAPDMEALQRRNRTPCLSMESRIPLSEFDMIGISLLYELNFTNILTLFDLSGIPFLADERPDDMPLIIGGGPCTFNPEPLADFFDAFVIGDGEAVILEICQAVIQWKKSGDGKKKTLMKQLSVIQGVYVPSLFQPGFTPGGIQTLSALPPAATPVKRAILPDLENAPFPMTPIVPFGKPVHDRLRLEVARGCSRGCRFCQAGMIYRPVRERSVERLLKITADSLAKTGYRDVSLLSLSTGDYSGLTRLMGSLLGLDADHCTAISLPSIRAEKLTPELMEIIRSVRKTGFTIAPEAGSQRLRDIINKNLSEESIEKTIENAFQLGWKNIKLYFMMGLPFETFEDIDAICELSKRLAHTKAKGKKTINVSIAPFIPKAHTPFERCSQISLDRSLENLQYLKDNLRHPKVKLKWQNPEMSVIEGVWSRGDRRLSTLLIEAWQLGCRLDGWSDQFRFDLWQEAFSNTGIEPDFFTTRKRSGTETLPWDHIDSGISKAFLKEEFCNAESLSLTPDCRENDCSGCGICDFDTIQPDIQPPAPEQAFHIQKPEPQDPNDFIKVRVVYSKQGDARFFGHLELVNIIERAIRRAGLTVRYTQGFNPGMKLSFDNPLPLGMASESESFYLYIPKGNRPGALVETLNKVLPGGLKIEAATLFTRQQEAPLADRYHIRFEHDILVSEAVEKFMELSELVVEDISRKGKRREVNLREIVEKISIIDRQNIEIVIKKNNQRLVRPGEILTRALGLSEADIHSAVITKKKQDH